METNSSAITIFDGTFDEMKSLKKLHLDEAPVEDAPFYVECALKTTSNINFKFEGIPRRFNLRKLARRYKHYQKTCSDESELFYKVLKQNKY